MSLFNAANNGMKNHGGIITDKLDVCVREGGPSFPSAIPGCNVPLGLFLTEVPDLVGAMAACPSPSSVCHE